MGATVFTLRMLLGIRDESSGCERRSNQSKGDEEAKQTGYFPIAFAFYSSHGRSYPRFSPASITRRASSASRYVTFRLSVIA